MGEEGGAQLFPFVVDWVLGSVMDKVIRERVLAVSKSLTLFLQSPWRYL